jgi:aspartyl-tRNA(Asn)/glutamyl-tRNA(Gln) amidotransferase subunit C
MAVTREDVLHVAALARLEVAPEQVQSFQHDLAAILEHFEKLNEIDTSNVLPTSHALSLENVFRDDVVSPSLNQEDALGNAPQKAYGHFRVPKVIE